MSLFLDRKYVPLLAPQFERFKQKNDFVWRMRCPICGDSQKNKVKTRGYIYRRKDALYFHCHNCKSSEPFWKLLKMFNATLYREYTMEKFAAQGNKAIAVDEYKTKPFANVVEKKTINLPTIESLHNEHYAKKFLVDRKIPTNFFTELFFAQSFKAFVDEIIPGNDKKLLENESRIVIPFYDAENNLIGFQGRALQKSDLKYITIKLDEDNKKIFGLNRLDVSKRIYVVEGPFDSLFLNNAIATMDSGLYVAPRLVGQNNDYTFIYDNEPRNAQVVKNIKRTIELGYNIFIWPQDMKCKDINEAILEGYDPSFLQSIIDMNTHSDLKAWIHFNIWKKV